MSVSQENERDQLLQQSVKYAKDLAEIYSQEKEKRRELEKLNTELKKEICSRQKAEHELILAREKLEERVMQRTSELSEMNRSLVTEIAERKKAEQIALEQLDQKDALLSEIHHRVKNNLQIISSLLTLQEMRVQEKPVLMILNDCQNRIRSMALIHERLYQAKDLNRIEFSDYLEDLAVELLRSQCTNSRINLISDLDSVQVGVKTAFPCGLITNELVSNSIKHAFDEDCEGLVKLSLKKDNESGFILRISDNGKGIDESLAPDKSKTLGLKLVKNLVERQLKGQLNICGKNGTEITISFQEPK